ncbi:MAG: glycosyltransferase family 4 protein [Clostridia bacterium]|nr:glycosyltransferase family 4 protein [Clostridia bacterium]
MRILILANDFKTLFNFRMELLERFIKEKYEVILSLPKDEKNQAFRDLGCSVIENNLTRHGTNPLKELKLIKEYKALIKSVKPDVVLTYTVKPNIYGSIACRKCKVSVLNNITGLGSTMQSKGLKQSVMFFLMRYAMKSSEVIFFQNEENMKLLNQNKITGKASVLLPGSGVNTQKHTFVPYPEENGKIKFIVVSRLRQDKGFDELFYAIKKLGKRDNIEFNVVGWCEEERYQKEIADLCEEYPVIYHGEKTQTQVHDLISECHCILHPSYHEGMANVLMEASSAGRACIASDISGCKEIIDENESGYTFPVKNAEKLFNCIEKFISLSENERKIMGENARAKIEKEFDRQIVIDMYLENINKTVNKGEKNNVFV